MPQINNYKTEPLTERYGKVKINHSQQMFRLLGQYLPEQANILEVGPGHGHFAREALRQGHQIEAIEPSDFFREKLEHDGFMISAESVPPIPKKDGTFDLVHASMVIENLPTSDDAAEFAAESARVLKPGGRISLIYPNYLTWGSFFFDEHYTHNFVTTPRRVAHLLQCQGFQVERTEHVLGWYWVEGDAVKHSIRHLTNCAMWFVHMPLARWSAEYLGFGELHWKIRKTFFEAIVMIARRID